MENYYDVLLMGLFCSCRLRDCLHYRANAGAIWRSNKRRTERRDPMPVLNRNHGALVGRDGTDGAIRYLQLDCETAASGFEAALSPWVIGPRDNRCGVREYYGELHGFE